MPPTDCSITPNTPAPRVVAPYARTLWDAARTEGVPDRDRIDAGAPDRASPESDRREVGTANAPRMPGALAEEVVA